MENNEMTLEEIFVNTLKVLVLANDSKNILYEEKLDDFYKTMVVIFGYLCIVQQLQYNSHDEYERLKVEAHEYAKKITDIRNTSTKSLLDKDVLDEYKASLRTIIDNMKMLRKNDKIEIYKIYSDKILNNRLSLVNCSCESIISALKVLISYDMNRLFERELYLESEKSRVLNFNELQQIHDTIIDKKIHEEFKKDFYFFFNREEVKFLKNSYSNYESLSLKSFHKILLCNLNRAVKLLRVIYRENKKNTKEFDISNIEEIYEEYKKNKYPYFEEFISTFEYVNYVNSLLNKIELHMSNDPFLEKIDILEQNRDMNKKLINLLNNRIFSADKKVSDDENMYFYDTDNDYAFLTQDYRSGESIDDISLKKINDSISLKKVSYGESNISEAIQESAQQIIESRYAIENLNFHNYSEAIRKQIALALRMEIYSSFVIVNQDNNMKKNNSKQKKYKKRYFTGGFNKIFIHSINSNAFSKSGKFKVDPNLVVKFLIDDNGIWTRMNFYLLFEKITRAYFETENKNSKPLSRETIDLFFSKFTDTFNGIGNRKNIKEIIIGFLKVFTETDLTSLIGKPEFDDAMGKISDATTYKGDFLIKLKSLI